MIDCYVEEIQGSMPEGASARGAYKATKKPSHDLGKRRCQRQYYGQRGAGEITYRWKFLEYWFRSDKMGRVSHLRLSGLTRVVVSFSQSPVGCSGWTVTAAVLLGCGEWCMVVETCW